MKVWVSDIPKRVADASGRWVSDIPPDDAKKGAGPTRRAAPLKEHRVSFNESGALCSGNREPLQRPK